MKTARLALKALTIFAIAVCATAGTVTPTAAESRTKFPLEEQCTFNEERTANFLQYLYKIDGNLREINSSKIKRIEFLEQQFRNSSTPRSEARVAFRELYNDPDWWHRTLQSRTRDLIAALENYKKERNWVTYKTLAGEQVSRKNPGSFRPASATKVMKNTLKLIGDTASFFVTLTEVENRLESLGERARLEKSLDSDMERRGYQEAFFKALPGEILGCQIEYLEHLLN